MVLEIPNKSRLNSRSLMSLFNDDITFQKMLAPFSKGYSHRIEIIKIGKVNLKNADNALIVWSHDIHKKV